MTADKLRAQRWGISALGALLAVFLLAPVLALLGSSSLTELARGLSAPRSIAALELSLFTSTVSLAIVCALGTPLAWTLAQSRTRFSRAVETVLQLPMVIPPAVAGVALLLAFGRQGLFSGVLYPRGESLAFSTAAVIIAEVFVSGPFFVQSAVAAFRAVDERTLLVARSFGAGPWRVLAQVAVPLASRGLVAGAAMSWARSLGEFGATLMFAGNLEGRTQTLPLAIYTAFESDRRAAQSLSIVLVLVALVVLLVVRATREDRTESAR